MSGERVLARTARKKKRAVARAENIAIAALAILAVILMRQTGILQNTLPGSGSTVEGGYTAGPAISLTGETPVRLMLSTGGQRYGVEYDQSAVDSLYARGLFDLLDQSLRGMETPGQIREETWQEALTGTGQWAFYDYLDNIAFDQQDRQGAGAGRYFLVTGRNGQAEAVYYYNETQRSYYSARIQETVDLPNCLTQAVSNDARFAFEDPAVSEILSPYMLVLREPPVCAAYTAADPLEDLSEQEWDQLLESLDFNAKAASPYTTATGSVIREGADTLRIMNDGTLQFHSSENGENRYIALSSREKDLQLEAEEILDRATGEVRGPAKVCCSSIRTLDDGQTEVIFHYLLSGARVQMWGEGWAARFLFRDNVVAAYTILSRSYVAEEETCPLLPVRQAAAAASAMGRRGAELQVVYQDVGNQKVLASWTVREPR